MRSNSTDGWVGTGMAEKNFPKTFFKKISEPKYGFVIGDLKKFHPETSYDFLLF